MPQGQFCNNRPITTDEELKHLLSDKGGAQYYEEMKHLDVDTEKLRMDLERTCKSKTRTWLEICAHCGMCADSCFLYRTNDQDPKQVPSYKIQSTLGVMLKKKGNVTNEFMRHCMDVAWSQCTCCNRCGMFCPHGIDVGVMISYLRGLLFSQGFVPWELKIGSGMHRVYAAQMDVSEEEFVETCEWMVEENEDEWPGLEIPVDKENADIMYTLNAREPKHYPEDIAYAAMLFRLAGENWTVPSSGWDQTSLAMFAGDWEGARHSISKTYASMERLKPKRVMGTECGHAHRASSIEGPYWCGIESGLPPVEYIHYVQWLAEALREGKIKIDPAKKIKEPCTLQDACNYVRNHGLGQYTREIMSYIAEDFREMPSVGDYNYCCGGGGGFNGIGKYHHERIIGLAAKRDQILATGATLVIAPCHNCWDAIRDLIQAYPDHMQGVRYSFMKPLILEMAIIPEHLKPQADEDDDE